MKYCNLLFHDYSSCRYSMNQSELLQTAMILSLMLMLLTKLPTTRSWWLISFSTPPTNTREKSCASAFQTPPALIRMSYRFPLSFATFHVLSGYRSYFITLPANHCSRTLYLPIIPIPVNPIIVLIIPGICTDLVVIVILVIIIVRICG